MVWDRFRIQNSARSCRHSRRLAIELCFLPIQAFRHEGVSDFEGYCQVADQRRKEIAAESVDRVFRNARQSLFEVFRLGDIAGCGQRTLVLRMDGVATRNSKGSYKLALQLVTSHGLDGVSRDLCKLPSGASAAT